MRPVSDELKTEIVDFLAGRPGPVRFCDVAQALGYLGYSDSTLRIAVRWLVSENTVECERPANNWPDRGEAAPIMRGTREYAIPRSYLYRLASPVLAE